MNVQRRLKSFLHVQKKNIWLSGIVQKYLKIELNNTHKIKLTLKKRKHTLTHLTKYTSNQSLYFQCYYSESRVKMTLPLHSVPYRTVSYRTVSLLTVTVAVTVTLTVKFYHNINLLDYCHSHGHGNGHGKQRYGTVRYGTVRYGTLCNGTVILTRDSLQI